MAAGQPVENRRAEGVRDAASRFSKILAENTFIAVGLRLRRSVRVSICKVHFTLWDHKHSDAPAMDDMDGKTGLRIRCSKRGFRQFSQNP